MKQLGPCNYWKTRFWARYGPVRLSVCNEGHLRRRHGSQFAFAWRHASSCQTWLGTHPEDWKLSETPPHMAFRSARPGGVDTPFGRALDLRAARSSLCVQSTCALLRGAAPRWHGAIESSGTNCLGVFSSNSAPGDRIHRLCVKWGIITLISLWHSRARMCVCALVAMWVN